MYEKYEVDGHSWIVWPENPNYIISSNGRIISKKTKKYLKLKAKRSGYPFWTYHINGKRHNIYVHRAVALLFIPFPKPYYLRQEVWDFMEDTEKYMFMRENGIVDHLDRDKSNPRANNLTWSLYSGNYKNSDHYENNYV